MVKGAPTRAVYTALFGRYELLQEQPIRDRSDVPFVCFTDDPDLTSSTWDLRLVEPAFPLDMARSLRYHKLLGAPLDAEFDETLWIDNRVILRESPEHILGEMLEGADVGVLHHSFRRSVLAEFDAVVTAGLDDPARVYEQLLHYAEVAPESLDLKPYWGGFIARRWTDEVRAAMRVWLDHVLRYSRRDQLSFRLATAPLSTVRAFDYDNLSSRWHEWLKRGPQLARDSDAREGAYRWSIRAPLARVDSLTAERAELRLKLAEAQRLLVQADERHAVALERVERDAAGRIEEERAARARVALRLEALENSRAVRLSRRVRRTLRRFGGARPL